MIKFVLPNSRDDSYVNVRGFLIGPLNSNGTSAPADEIEYRHHMDYISNPAKGIYHENNVGHIKTEAELKFVPLSSASVPSPTAQYPYRVTVDVKAPGATTITKLNLDHGLGLDKRYSVSRGSTSWEHLALTMTGPYDFFLHTISGSSSNPNRVTYASATRFIFDRTSGSMIYYKHYQPSVNLAASSFPSQPYYGVELDYDAVLAAFGSAVFYKTWEEVTPGSTYGYRYLEPKARSWTLADTKLQLDKLVALELNPGVFPIEDKHYGNLAMEASAQVNATSVNMIAFLRDLKNPKALIPKLRKLKDLKNLKVLSNDYLAVKFGILPTVSDLEDIWKAMHKVKPYIDKNGFSTYSAGYSSEKKVDNINFSLTQRIKLGIADEDSVFDDLSGKLDSVGLLPTLQNAYDLIPYSFIVDWFVGVGDFLEQIDARARIARLNIRYTTQSRKTTAETRMSPDHSFPFVGSVKQVHYHRWVSDQCPVPPLSLDPTFQDFNHWLEAGALLAQRSKS